MRLIDADEFDRKLAAAEFDAALNNADDESRPFTKQTMYYLTKAFRDVMRHRPTVDAIPVEWLTNMEYGEDEELSTAANTVFRAWLTMDAAPIYPSWGEYLCSIGLIHDCTDSDEVVYRLFDNEITAFYAEKLGIMPKERQP